MAVSGSTPWVRHAALQADSAGAMVPIAAKNLRTHSSQRTDDAVGDSVACRAVV